ncbi:ABC transporter substrate-binding protein [Subtercola boreus]|uniref:ABC transporter substrate-binding protein n=1 Tax=Subtercola boreus TaxID=120213 RepID=A0A3E0VSK3_9MICO|nr:ABC transporter permease [Subtercola boreus]RFA12992.1 ABC transporter substrate-binding protein [Subtercola boreus]
MYVALRDLRFARGRFILIASVVALITLLVGFLAGLTAGLANQNISAVLALPADRIVFSLPADGSSLSYSDSTITAAQAATWSAAPGISSVHPVGISQTRLHSGSRQVAVALFGADTSFGSAVPRETGHITLPATAASTLHAAVGDTVTLAGAGYVVDAVTADTWYSHTAVAWVSLVDWQSSAGASGNPGAFSTVLAVDGTDAGFSSADTATGTTSQTPFGSLTALSAFRSEIGSLLLMVAMLFGISALVVGAFFTVWGMQRQPDVAILKALGASNRMLVTDSLGEAALVLVVGVGVGIGATAGFGAVVGSVLPFILAWYTTLVPAVAMIALGLLGAAFALRSVTRADPLTALGSNR